MNAALKMVFSLGQVRYVNAAALKNSGLGNSDVCESAGAFRNRGRGWPIKLWYEASAEMGYLREGMRLAALVDNVENRSLRNLERIGLEVPLGVRVPGLSLME